MARICFRIGRDTTTVASVGSATGHIVAATVLSLVCLLGLALVVASIRLSDTVQAQVATQSPIQTQTVYAESFHMPVGAAAPGAVAAVAQIPPPRIAVGDAESERIKRLPAAPRTESPAAASTSAPQAPQPPTVVTNCMTGFDNSNVGTPRPAPSRSSRARRTRAPSSPSRCEERAYQRCVDRQPAWSPPLSQRS
jgi:hypothetical protein